jgi:hypothetical protein
MASFWRASEITSVYLLHLSNRKATLGIRLRRFNTIALYMRGLNAIHRAQQLATLSHLTFRSGKTVPDCIGRRQSWLLTWNQMTHRCGKFIEQLALLLDDSRQVRAAARTVTN